MPYEPYWDPEKESWPGLYGAGGKPINEGIIYESHLGVWCEWSDVGSLGVIALTEIEFRDDGHFVWHQMRYENRVHDMSTREGTWSKQGDVLMLAIESTDETDCVPQRRAEFRIFDRKERLGLKLIRLDDKVSESF